MAAIPYVTMKSGAAMPQLAFGMYLIPRAETRAAVRNALAVGYRHFDSASFYDNEAEAGAELQAWLATGHVMSEIFVTTKVWTTDLGDPMAAKRSAEISIDELGLGYVHLLMVHWPMPGKHVAAYLALEELVRSGKAMALGVSNYTPQDYEELMRSATIPPQVNTFEVNPMLYRKEWIDYFQSRGITMQCYKPLQRGGDALKADVAASIAARLGKTTAQVCLRWAVQKELVVLVKSVKPERMVENASIFDFELTPEDVEAIDGLTTEEAIKTAAGHYDKRRTGTTAPWGDGQRPDRRSAI